MQEPLLAVDDLTIAFPYRGGLKPVIENVSFELVAGTTLCLVGESGSGKSMSCLAALDILPPAARIVSGAVRFRGKNVRDLARDPRQRFRGGRVAMVFQDPVGAINPAHKIGAQIRETFHLHAPGSDWRSAAMDLLARVGLSAPERVLAAYPHELSGGMNQRVMIAMALAGNPDLLIADEPTTALDATIQAQILDLLADLQAERGLSILLVTHDIGVAAQMADRIAVMHRGRLVELGDAATVLNMPVHAHARALVSAAHIAGGDWQPARAGAPA